MTSKRHCFLLQFSTPYISHVHPPSTSKLVPQIYKHPSHHFCDKLVFPDFNSPPSRQYSRHYRGDVLLPAGASAERHNPAYLSHSFH